jgi:hypothetical protein
MRCVESLQLGRQASRGQGGRHPAQRGARRRAGERRDLLQPGLVDPRGRQRLSDPPGLVDTQGLQAVEQGILGVGRVERVERRAGGAVRHGLLLQRDELRRLLTLDARLDEARHRRADDLDHLGHLGGRAARRGGRVVQLVREAGGHRAQRGEPLAVRLVVGDAADDRRDLGRDALVDGPVGEDEPARLGRVDDGQAARRVGAQAHLDLLAGQHGDRAHPGRRVVAPRGLGAIGVEQQRLHDAVEQQQQPERGRALLGEDRAVGHAQLARGGDPLVELRIVEVVEQVDRAQVGARDPGGRHASTRYSWMSETAIEPSPTALATRLIERARTSPATKTPGTVVSSR